MNPQQMRLAWAKAAGHSTTEDTTMNEAALDAALRRKFRHTGARGALRTLGFDSAEIDDVLEDTNMRTLHPRRPGDTRAIKSLAARDEAGEPLDAAAIIEFLDEALEDMSPEEAD